MAAGAAVAVALTPTPTPTSTPTGTAPRVVTPPLTRLVVTSPYGPRVLQGRLGFHRGVDLRARMGTPLAAVGPGVVEKTHVTAKGGLSVVVALDGGWRAGYAHLSRIDVEEGERVAPGARVGLSGDTGTAKGAPHLHFELRDPRSRQLVDPWPHIAGMGVGGRTTATDTSRSLVTKQLERHAWRAWRDTAPLRRRVARAL